LDKKRKKWRELLPDQYTSNVIQLWKYEIAWIFYSVSGIHYYDVAFFNRKWPQQKQFSPTFRNIVFCEAKASKGKKTTF
jgi:hypothetical protein